MAEEFDLGALVEDFRDEAGDQIDRLDAALLELEREGSLGSERRSSLLRTLHTLKGNAGMLGFAPVRDFVHALENVLKGEPERWDAEAVERLFGAAAALRSAVEAAGRKGQAESFSELTSARHRLEEIEESGSSALSGGDEEPEPEADAGGDRVRVPFEKLDTLLADVGELMGEALALEQELRDRARSGSVGSAEVRALRDRAETVRRRSYGLRDSVMALRLVPVSRVLRRFHGLVRRLAAEQGKEARLVVEGEQTELDKSTADALAEPLLHLVRNAIDHGLLPPEAREAEGKPRHGTIRIRAEQQGDRVRIEVEDDGVGLDLRRIRRGAEEAGLVDPGADVADEVVARMIFRAGFSTRSDVSTVSGRGVGLDVVRRSIRDLRGEVELQRPGSGGTRFVLRLPLTVAMVPSLVFDAAGERLALPAEQVARTVRIEALERIGSAPVLRSGDELLPVLEPSHLFDWGKASDGRFGVIVEQRERRGVLRVERLVDQRDLVVKALPAYGGGWSGVSGASVLPGGRVILVLDPGALLEAGERAGPEGTDGG